MKDGARGGFGLTAEPNVVVQEITTGEENRKQCGAIKMDLDERVIPVGVLEERLVKTSVRRRVKLKQERVEMGVSYVHDWCVLILLYSF